MKLSFRPHHFMCTLGFQGMGYSPEFIQNYTQLIQIIQENEDLPIEVVKNTDSICKPCPHRRGAKCRGEAKIQTLDARHSQILNIHPGDFLSWREAKARIKDHMTVEAFHEVCSGCEWKILGVCEKSLLKFRNEGLS